MSVPRLNDFTMADKYETNMSQKEFMKEYRGGQSKNYLKYSPKDNFPVYGTGDKANMTSKHLTLDVSAFFFLFLYRLYLSCE